MEECVHVYSRKLFKVEYEILYALNRPVLEEF